MEASKKSSIVKNKKSFPLMGRFGTLSSEKQNNISGYLFISPFIIGFLSFIVVPMAMSLYMSFHDYDMLSSPEWVGLDNFTELFTEDSKFIQSLKVTFTYVLTAVPLRLITALAVALLINRKSKLSGAYRVLFYLPSVIGGSVAVSIMWRNIFGDTGLINGLFTTLGLDPVYFFKHQGSALGVLVLLAAWQFGSSMLVFLSGLKNIPNEYYEAAEMDGAGKIRQFFSITMPSLSPILFFNIVMQTIQSFLTFTPAYIISNGSGSPMNGTLVYSLYVYQKAFSEFKMGYASAMAWVILVIIGTVTLLLFATSKFWVHSESGEG